MSSFVKTWVFETLLLVALAVPVFGAGCERQPDPPVKPRSAAPDAAQAVRAAGASDAGAPPAAIEVGGSRAGDAVITARVKTALMADDQVKGLAIDVATRDAEVTLKGALDHKDQVTRAMDVARTVEGVRDVVNRLTVKGEDKAAQTHQG